MVKSELGSKRIDPETGRKFYDLNKDPIISPYTGKSYARSFFEASEEKSVSEDEDDLKNSAVDADDPELLVLSDSDDPDEDVVNLPGLDDEDDFLEEEKDISDDVSDIIIMADDEDCS